MVTLASRMIFFLLLLNIPQYLFEGSLFLRLYLKEEAYIACYFSFAKTLPFTHCCEA